MKRIRFWPFFAVCLTSVAIIVSCKMHYEPQPVSYSISPSGSSLERGRHMTILMCAPCHLNPETKQLSGMRMVDAPKIIGKLISHNLTQDPEKGIGSYTDAQLAYLLRTGISKDGKFMPFMQRPNLSDEDLSSILVFLHSNDPLVKPSSADAGKTHYSALGKFAISNMMKPLEYPNSSINTPDVSDKVGYGRYLVYNLSCYDCHSHTPGANIKEPEKSKGYMAGGGKFLDRSGKTVRAANLTPHKSGIADWEEKDFVRALKDGIRKNNAVIRYPMPLFSELTDEEASAIYTYIRTVPPIENEVKR